MCSTLARATLVSWTLIVAFGSIGAPPAIGQTRIASVEDLRRELAVGDSVTVISTDGHSVAGRLIRLGNVDLAVRLVGKRAAHEHGPRHVTIPFDGIQSLERRRDPAGDGAAIGAGVGAAFGGAMFAYATIVDLNELEEWAPLYIGAAAVCTGIGALIGWAIDAAHSKPHIIFNGSRPGTRYRVRPMYIRGRGIALAVSFSR